MIITFKIQNKRKCSHKWVISLIPESCIYSPVKSLSRHFWKKRRKKKVKTTQCEFNSFLYTFGIKTSCCFYAYSQLICNNLPLNASIRHGSVSDHINNDGVKTKCLIQNSAEGQLSELRTCPWQGYLAEDDSKPFTFSNRMKRGILFNLQTEHRLSFFLKTAL